jgi:predicted nucleotidyltransferase
MMVIFKMKKETIEQNTIFLTLAGSRAYGTETPESDYDYRGICVIPDNSYYFGIGINKFEQADKIFDSSDKVVYDIRKVLFLMCQGNPNVIELAFTDREFFILCSPLWEMVLDNKQKFLSKKLRHTFSGYAFAQLNRIKRHRNYLLNPPKKKPERSDYGLPEKKLVADDDLGAFQWLISKLLEDSVEVMNLSEATKEELKKVNYIGLAQRNNFNDIAQEIKQLTQAPDGFVDVVMREKSYKAAMNEWTSYHNWKETRNVKRQELESKFGYDTKHAMHLIRLMRMCVEVFEKNELNVYRPDREELKEIRNGAWSYEQVVEFANDSEKKLDELYKTSTLPKVPDYNFFDDMCCNLVEEYLRQHSEKSKNLIRNR